jgi:hypothetical protein
MRARACSFLLVAGLVSGGLAPWLVTPASSATGTDPAKDLPRPGCVTLSDPKTDTTPLMPASNLPAWPVPNDPDLDLTSLTMRTTATELVAYLGVDKLDTGPMTTDGHRFTLDFTFNKHVFSAAASSYSNGSGALRDGLAETGQAGHVVQLGVDVPSLTAVPPATDKGFKESGLKATWDLPNNRVVLQLPIADIVKYGGAPFTGDLTALDAKTATDSYAISTQADNTNPGNASAGTAKWRIGDNACFAPPPAVLVSTGATTAQYGDKAPLAVSVKTAAGAPLAGRTVTFALGGSNAVRGTSDAAGIARALMTVSTTAGSSVLTATFAGDSAADAATLSIPFTVTLERTVTKLAVTKRGNARTVAITLVDDDRTPVAGQRLLVYVNGKAAGAVTTNGAGKAVFTKGNPTQTVKVVYAGLAGKYAGSSAQVRL